MKRHTREDEEYFNGLYRKMYRSLYLYVCAQYREDSDVEDVIQETFREVFVHIDAVKASPNPEGYVMNVLKYKMKKLWEDKKKHSAEEAICSERVCQESAESSVEVWDLCEKILKKGEYLVVRKRYYEGKRIADIAKELKISEGACKMRIQRSLGKLKKVYEREQRKG